MLGTCLRYMVGYISWMFWHMSWYMLEACLGGFWHMV
jgi:hypothetical protein